MSGRFPSDWLALREPVDHLARAHSLLPRLHDWCAGREPLYILDLGAGTGSNLRWLSPRLTQRQNWTLVDHDPALLALARIEIPGVQWHCIEADLSDWERYADQRPYDLVTASALLDLVSKGWLDTLVDACRQRGSAVLMALSYDGQIEWSTPDPGDASICAAVNAHQNRNKGLGAALGPSASIQLAKGLRAANYHVWIEPSTWDIGGERPDLARMLVDGWVAAATEQDPARESGFRAWGARRCRDLASGHSRVRVGHQDLLALPDTTR